MSLRSVGNQLLQTAPSPLLAGASTASLSLWVCVNPGCNVANPSGVNIFGDTGGKLSATLSGSGGLQLGWSSHNGTTNGQSTCSLTLAPGTSYHLAAIWQSGSQQYYVNGVQIDSDTQTGSIGVLADAAPHSFRLGSDSAGTDVTLDEPTLWVGYALSAQDVRNLRDRIVHPEGIAPASIALEWSLAGADGVAALVGDAGLADSSATGLNLSSVVGTAPTYQAGVLSYAPVATIGTASVGPSGRSIIAVVEDGTGVPANVKSLKPTDNVQLLTLTGAPAGGFTLTFGGQTTATIPFQISMPLNYGIWTASVAAGVAQQIAATWIGLSFLSPGQLFEVFDTDGKTLLGSATCDFTHKPTGFADGTNPDGNSTIWQSLGTFTPTGTTITVRISATAGTALLADGLWVKNTSNGMIQYLDDQNPAAFAMFASDSSSNSVTNQVHWYNGTYTIANGTGVGLRYTVAPAAIQAALLALPSVQAEGLTVIAADSKNSGPYTVQFGGPMGGVQQPLLVASDPTISPSIVNAGGDFPSIQINGGAPIPLKSPVWGPGLPSGVGGYQVNPYLPYVMWPLPQSAPDTQIVAALAGLFTFTGSLNYGSPGYGNPTVLATGSGTATWLFPCQPAASYRAAVTWTASGILSNQAGYAITDNAGNTLATVAVDQTAAPADFTDAGVGWKVLGTFALPTNTDLAIVLGAGGASVLADAARLDRVGADSSIVIKPTDVVTLSASNAWATTVAGPVDGATSLPLLNLAGGSSLPPFDSAPKTMRIGYNVVGENPFGSILVYANLAKRIQWGGGFTAADVNGYPLKLTGSTLDVLVSGGCIDAGGKGKGLSTLPNGNYTFVWDGACDVAPFSGGDTTATSVGNPVLTHTTDNQRVFNFQNGPSTLSPSLWFRLHGTTPDPADPTGLTYLCDLQNLRIYPPGVDFANPPKFHPSFVSKLQGVDCLRFLDPLQTNSGNVHDYSDFNTAAKIDYFDSNRVLNIPVASVSGYTGPPSGFDATNFVVIQITTAQPHGLSSGQYATLTNTGTAQLSNGSTLYLGYSGCVVQVVSPTVLLMGLAGDSSNPHRTMTNVVTDGAGSLQVYIGGGGMVFTDCIELCNVVGADLYLNIPPEASDDCVTAMADYVAANLAVGRKVHVEFANECWNFSFNAYASCCLKSVVVLGGGYNYYEPYYVYRMKQIHDLFAAPMLAASRSGDFIRVMGSQGGNPGITTALVTLANQGGATVDELAVAPYFSNQSVACGLEPTLVPTYNLMTTDQNLDLFELNILYGQIETFVSNHRPILDNAGFQSTKIVCYEGGPEEAIPSSNTANFARRNHAAIRHPRMFRVMLGFLQKIQDAGCSIFNDYFLSGGIGGAQWAAYFGWNMQPGTGSPTLDAINITDPEAVDQIKSEVGGALSQWAVLSGGSTPPTPTPTPTPSPTKPKRNIPGRNGQIRSTGFPRGLFRPSR